MNRNNATTPEIVYRGFALGPFETNCYVVRTAGSTGCWIVDAGFEPGELLGYVRQEGLTPEALVLTHAHADHMAGVREAVEAFPGMPVWIHEAEGAWLGDPQLNLSAAMGMGITAPGPDRLLEDNQELTLDGSRWRVLHTPGHSPGGITLYCESAGLALVGDALFAGSIGRTDFPGCSFERLETSIRERLYPLPDATRCLPGHGPETTIGREKASNPFVRPG